VFKLDQQGNFSILHTFNGPDGFAPYSRLYRDSAGNLYGTTKYGGSAPITAVIGLYPPDPGSYAPWTGLGTVFKLSPTGEFTLLHSFTGSSGDGAVPEGGLVADPSGNLYGATSGYSVSIPDWAVPQHASWGNVFRIDSSGNYSSLYSLPRRP